MYLDGIYVFDKKATLPEDAKTETFSDWYLILYSIRNIEIKYNILYN